MGGFWESMWDRRVRALHEFDGSQLLEPGAAVGARPGYNRAETFQPVESGGFSYSST